MKLKPEGREKICPLVLTDMAITPRKEEDKWNMIFKEIYSFISW